MKSWAAGNAPGKGADRPAEQKPKPAPPFPGGAAFGPGKSGAQITLLGQQLVRKGFGRHYSSGPGPRWTESDRLNVADFQRSRRELAGDPDGIPGPLTWRLLFS
ncbi:peptidoglycan-binding protein [Streptomyces noursei]|uniref:peptidoglycan-binding protein n=1 Tax=Streptomyces noursei TaxID=1971 RepID=UPI00344EF674